MAVPSTITDLDIVAGNNFPQDSDLTGPTVASTPRALSAILKKQFVKGTDIAVTASGTLTVPSENSYFVLTGTGFNITGLTDAYNGRVVTLEMPAGLTLVNSASLVLKGYNRVSLVGDTVTLVNKSAGVWKEICYNHANGKHAVQGSRNGTNQAGVAADTDTKIVFTFEELDNASLLNTGTGTITIKTPGVYSINAQVRALAFGSISSIGISIRKNGTQIKRAINGMSADNASAGIFAKVILAAGDTIEIYGYFYSGAGTIFGAADYTFVNLSLEE